MRSVEDTVTSGGRSSGREWKLWYSFGTGGVESRRVLSVTSSAPGLSGTATVKLHANGVLLPASTSTAWTVTSSPGVNGFAGTKLAPSPSE